MSAVTAGATRLYSTLLNRRFRWLLIATAGTASLVGYVVQTIVVPAISPGYSPLDFWVYLHAAWALAHHQDPYTYTSACSRLIKDPAFNRAYVYPPFLAWILQPIGQPYVPGFPRLTASACIEQTRTVNHALDIAELLTLQASFVASVLLLLRVLRVRDRQLQVFAIVLATSWLPVRMDLYGEVNLVLLLLAVLWLRGWLSDRPIVRGAALGLIFAVKLLAAPLLLLEAWARRWMALAMAGATVALAWVISDPRLLPTYFLKVAPGVTAGTGFRENQAPTGTIARLLHPSTFYGQNGVQTLDVRVLALAVALAVLGWTYLVLRRSRDASDVRSLQAAAVFSAYPLVVSLQTPFQYVLLLIPIFVLLVRAIERREQRLLWIVIGVWTLTGPVHAAFLSAIAEGFRTDWALRLWAESGIVGLVALWWASVRELAAVTRSAREKQLRPVDSYRLSPVKTVVDSGVSS